MNTIILLIMYQIFSSLLGQLPFSLHFFLHFYGVTFFGTPNMIEPIDFDVSSIFRCKILCSVEYDRILDVF